MLLFSPHHVEISNSPEGKRRKEEGDGNDPIHVGINTKERLTSPLLALAFQVRRSGLASRHASVDEVVHSQIQLQQ